MENKNGISLVSLIITIIVLLILTAITLNSIINDEGILKRANTAKQTNYESGIKQDVDLALASLETKFLSNTDSLKNRTEIFTEENLNKELKNIGKIKENTFMYKEDGSISFTFLDNNTNSELEYTYNYSGNLKEDEIIVEEKFVAQFENEKFDSLEEAILAVPEDSNTYTVKLLKDTEECITIKANQCINLDLNGHEIQNNENVITNQGKLYVNGGSIISGGSTITTNGKSLVVGNESPCNLKGTGEASVIFSNMGGVEFYSGTITNSSENNAGPCIKMYENGANNQLYMYGGEIICNSGYGVYINGARAFIYGGTITSTSTNGNACYADGYLTIGKTGESGPTIKGDGYTLIRPIAYTTYIYSGNFELKTSGNIIKAAGGTIYVNGGNFVNESPSDLIGVSGARIYINGGTFTSNTSYCMSIKSGYLYVKGGNFFGENQYILSRTGGTYSITGGTYNDVTITDQLVKK